MEQEATEISEILRDYHIDRPGGFVMNPQNVTNWVNQFEENDRFFMLSEFTHILKQGVYVSKERGKACLLSQVEYMTKRYGYKTPLEYLGETIFLRMQEEHKSQDILLNLLNTVLLENFDVDINYCGSKGIKNLIYIDDVLASGKTVLGHCNELFKKSDYWAAGNLQGVVTGKIRFAILVFCKHTWAVNNIQYSLSKSLKSPWLLNNLVVLSHYAIENNIKDFDPKINLVYPAYASAKANQFLQSLDATNYEDRSLRPKTSPTKETLFSSPANRLRFESIVLDKGVEILSKVGQLAVNSRPLGNCNPTYKTFGSGTMFFSWNNISNTCPIVFWWSNPAHDWHGLFPLYKRGVN
jgi:hypothetical protein